MMKMKKASTAIVLAGILLINTKALALANEEISVNDVVTTLNEIEMGEAPLANRLVISGPEQQLYETIETLLAEQGIEESTESHTWVSVPLERTEVKDSEIRLLEITKDQYATYLSYELNSEIYQLTYYANGAINKKITMYIDEEEYIYAQNYNNEILSSGDSSELNHAEEEQEDPVVVDLKETKVQLQQRLDILAVIFATGLFAVVMFFIWGKQSGTKTNNE